MSAKSNEGIGDTLHRSKNVPTVNTPYAACLFLLINVKGHLKGTSFRCKNEHEVVFFTGFPSETSVSHVFLLNIPNFCRLHQHASAFMLGKS